MILIDTVCTTVLYIYIYIETSIGYPPLPCVTDFEYGTVANCSYEHIVLYKIYKATVFDPIPIITDMVATKSQRVPR